MKNYEIYVYARATVFVEEAKDGVAAIDHAISKLNFGDFKMHEANVICEVPTTPGSVESSRKYADVTLNMTTPI